MKVIPSLLGHPVCTYFSLVNCKWELSSKLKVHFQHLTKSKSGNEKDYWSAAKLPGSGSQKLSIFHTSKRVRERLSIEHQHN